METKYTLPDPIYKTTNPKAFVDFVRLPWRELNEYAKGTRRLMPGDLIRNTSTPSFINIVLEVSEVDKVRYVRSVRFAKVRHSYDQQQHYLFNEQKRMCGKRSRSLTIRPGAILPDGWHLVREVYKNPVIGVIGFDVTVVDNKEEISEFLTIMNGVETAYKGNNE